MFCRRFSHGFHMRFSIVFALFSDVLLIVFARCSYAIFNGFRIDFVCLLHVFCIDFKFCVNDFPMISWFSHGFPMFFSIVVAWFS